MNSNFLAALLANIDAPADPALDAVAIADAHRRDAATTVRILDARLARTIATYGYGRRSDAVALDLAAARRA